MIWRVGQHYNIHVYEEDRPVATFFDPADARRAVDAVNADASKPAPQAKPLDPAIIEEYVREMNEKVIPEIEANEREQAILRAEQRHKPLFSPAPQAPEDAERSAFEAWERQRHVTMLDRNPIRTWGDEKGKNYIAPFIQASWEAWQARAALAAADRDAVLEEAFQAVRNSSSWAAGLDAILALTRGASTKGETG